MSTNAASLSGRIGNVEDRVARACVRAGRNPDTVEILPVSKGQPETLLREWLALERGPRRLAENYSEELSTKAGLFSKDAIEWHFLGRLQSRKIEEISTIASVLHAVSRVKELQILRAQSRVPDFYVQVNISDEAQKNGVDVSELESLLVAITSNSLEARFRGLMGMASPIEIVGASVVRAQFAKLREYRDRMCPGTKLNMGMSGDFEIAIEEGANLVRLGSLLFGERS